MDNKNLKSENIDDNDKTAEEISEFYERQSRRYNKNLDVGNEVK